MEIMEKATEMYIFVAAHQINKCVLIYLESIGKVIETVLHLVITFVFHLLLKRIHHVLEGSLQPLDCALLNFATPVKLVEVGQLLDIPEQ